MPLQLLELIGDVLVAVGGALKNGQDDCQFSSRRRLSELQSFIDLCMQGPITDSDRATFLMQCVNIRPFLTRRNPIGLSDLELPGWLTETGTRPISMHVHPVIVRKTGFVVFMMMTLVLGQISMRRLRGGDTLLYYLIYLLATYAPSLLAL
ncbi:hypothetical protein V6N13_116634 [Hibiscus sabdariffa]